jgi:hypothetical protein
MTNIEATPPSSPAGGFPPSAGITLPTTLADGRHALALLDDEADPFVLERLRDMSDEAWRATMAAALLDPTRSRPVRSEAVFCGTRSATDAALIGLELLDGAAEAGAKDAKRAANSYRQQHAKPKPMPDDRHIQTALMTFVMDTTLDIRPAFKRVANDLHQQGVGSRSRRKPSSARSIYLRLYDKFSSEPEKHLRPFADELGLENKKVVRLKKKAPICTVHG